MIKKKKITKIPNRTTNGNGELSIRDQGVAELYARGIRPYDIAEKQGISPMSVYYILRKAKVKEEVLSIQKVFYQQLDPIISEAYSAGWKEWGKRVPDLTPEQILEGLSHIEAMRGMRKEDGSADLTLTETHQKKITLADNLSTLNETDLPVALKAISSLIKQKPKDVKEIDITPEK